MHILSAAFTQKLKSASLHLCRCWLIARKDGVSIGLTDHDMALEFGGTTFLADAGMTASAVEMSADLARDGSEVMAIFGSPHILETDVSNGLFDGANISLWLVDWKNTENRLLLMQGKFGQVRHEAGAFHVTLEGSSSVLQQPVGRVYQKKCDAELGDKKCLFVLQNSTYRVATQVTTAQEREVEIPLLPNYADGWFAHGTLKWETGASLTGDIPIRSDVIRQGRRYLGLWESLTSLPAVNAPMTLTAGCDKRTDTCRRKFSNIMNFQGMPHMPSDHLLIKAVD